MDKIKLGDPQPKPCGKCGENYGYQVTDNVRGTYTTIYEANGEHYGGFYGDGMREVRKGIKGYCQNCGHDLKLKIDRTDG